MPHAGRGTRGKRKKAPAPTAATSSAAAAADTDAAVGPQDVTEVDVMAVGVQDETKQSWQALLAVSAEICSGIGMALQHQLCKCLTRVGHCSGSSCGAL